MIGKELWTFVKIGVMAYSPYNLQDVYDASAQEKFKVISTFAGGGGSSTGYRLAGGKVLVINEYVPVAAETYAENYPDTVILPGDIKELTGQDFLDAAGVGVGEITYLMEVRHAARSPFLVRFHITYMKKSILICGEM